MQAAMAAKRGHPPGAEQHLKPGFRPRWVDIRDAADGTIYFTGGRIDCVDIFDRQKAFGGNRRENRIRRAAPWGAGSRPRGCGGRGGCFRAAAFPCRRRCQRFESWRLPLNSGLHAKQAHLGEHLPHFGERTGRGADAFRGQAGGGDAEALRSVTRRDGR